jgi:hypothetical protein
MKSKLIKISVLMLCIQGVVGGTDARAEDSSGCTGFNCQPQVPSPSPISPGCTGFNCEPQYPAPRNGGECYPYGCLSTAAAQQFPTLQTRLNEEGGSDRAPFNSEGHVEKLACTLVTQNGERLRANAPIRSAGETQVTIPGYPGNLTGIYSKGTKPGDAPFLLVFVYADNSSSASDRIEYPVAGDSVSVQTSAQAGGPSQTRCGQGEDGYSCYPYTDVTGANLSGTCIVF